MAKRVYFPPLNDWIVGVRQSFGVQVFYQGKSPLAVVRFLKRKNVLGILPDQDIRDLSGIFTPFFGVDAWTPTGPAALALAAQVPLYVVYLVWDRGCYRPINEGPLPFPNTGSRADHGRVDAHPRTRGEALS
jgi:lauroyl/myristoyl acyltransferase